MIVKFCFCSRIVQDDLGSSWDDQLKFAPEIAQIAPGDFSPRIGQADRGIVPGRSVQCKRQRAGLFQN
ncbi:hypothetical protein MA16_Dca020727 [Dendrobium catenatum]|uniref:Uncharacterized protein n=1 Tax=Dendrobium catenatum TaxID=906689 RepID=A0A2I0X7F1_9ASPA|nr:hypothetical protein MA16_Dca020727 [Dendrobium catenatum]